MQKGPHLRAFSVLKPKIFFLKAVHPAACRLLAFCSKQF